MRSRYSVGERCEQPPNARLPIHHQADASISTTSVHMPATKIATSAKAAAKPTPIPSQSRPDDSLPTSKDLVVHCFPWSPDDRVACVFPGREPLKR